MNIIKQSAVYVDSNNGYKTIERCGRICYKSEENMTDGSDIRFCKAMLKNGHHAMLEHATVYAIVSRPAWQGICRWIANVKTGETPDNITPYIRMSDYKQGCVISLSFRVVIEAMNYFTHSMSSNSSIANFLAQIANAYPDLFNTETLGEEFQTRLVPLTSKKGMSNICVFYRNTFINYVNATYDKKDACEIFKKHLTHTIVFTTNRGVTHELVRHRPASFAQESTRYCNYSKDKFGNEITVIEPCFFEKGSDLYTAWKTNCENSEKAYFDMLNKNASAQQARGVLVHDVKTDIAITATEAEWQHILDLRYHGTTGAPHPQAKELMAIAVPMLRKYTDDRVQ